MLLVNSVFGNVYKDFQLKEKIDHAEKQGELKQLFLSRTEMEKSHQRKNTEDGMEIGLSLEAGTTLHNGDVLSNGTELILVNQLPEKVLHAKAKSGNESSSVYLQLGHIIGNRHRPISISDDGSVQFPIHDDSEIELFTKLFHEIIDHITLTIQEQIFVANQGMNVHEH
jgi:urease accessory protein